MSISGNRRALVALLALTLALGLLASWTFSQRPAEAQASTTVVVSDIAVTPVNGFATLVGGSNDGLMGIHCGPASPLGGAVIPGIVITKLEATQVRLRIQRSGANNPSVNGTEVLINCAAEVVTGTAAARQFQHHASP
jgi:hypothetical protein